jgi:DNA-binding transcriptional regulator YdaS (Cro superfamily)
MDLSTYLKPAGAAAKLARLLGVPPAMVSQWKHGTRSIPVHVCVQIEDITGGLVTCEEMLPDVDWLGMARCLARRLPVATRIHDSKAPVRACP